MGNTSNTAGGSLSSSRWTSGGHDLAVKQQIQISTDKADGFYFAGERLSGTVEIPISYLHQYLHTKNNRKPTELVNQRLIHNTMTIELVGDATYSAEVDAAADSDGHSTHAVNVCRQRCFLTINPDDNAHVLQQNDSPSETTQQASDSPTLPSSSIIKGTFELPIPENVPPSLINNRPPSVLYTLELDLSSGRHRYQIPIMISSKGCFPHPSVDIELNRSVMNQHNICLQAFLSKKFYRPGEQIPIRVSYSNPQQRFIRSVTVTLMQFYRIHNDQYSLQLDGKEWTFDVPMIVPQVEWFGETLLQLPHIPLQASFANQLVGTTQQIACELDYKIFLQLSEKKGDDLQLALPSIHVTYQNRNFEA